MKKISSLTLALGFILPLAGCPGDDAGTDTNSSPTTTMDPTGTDPTGTDPTGTDPTGTDPTGTDPTGTDPTGMADSTTAGGGGEGGFCAPPCRAAADCGDETLFDCVDMFCEFIGEVPACDATTCDDILPGNTCLDIEGVSLCVTPCDDDSMCIPDVTECTGMDDAGASFCAGLPCGGVAEGEACEFGGTCQADGSCTCTTDEECPDMTACNA